MLGAEDCSVTFTWLTGHQGIEANEIGDEMARRGADSVFIELEPFGASVAVIFVNRGTFLRCFKNCITFRRNPGLSFH